MQRSFIMIGGLLGLSLAGCLQVRGSGNVVTLQRSVDDFDSIEFRTVGNLDVQFGERTLIELTGDDNILPLLTTEVKAGRLIIDNSSSFSSRNGPAILLTMRELKGMHVLGSGDVRISAPRGESLDIRVSGSGNVQALDAQVNTLRLSITGSGDLHLSGKAQRETIRIVGSGDVAAGDMSVASAEVSISGSGDARVNASDELTATITGSGDIRYQGSPKLTKKIQGSGDVNAVKN